MTEKPNILEQAFDYLSSFPYFKVRKIFQSMWVFSTVLFGFAILAEGIAIYKGIVELKPEWIKNLTLWTGVNPLFAYIFYLWKKRDNEKKVVDSRKAN